MIVYFYYYFYYYYLIFTNIKTQINKLIVYFLVTNFFIFDYILINTSFKNLIFFIFLIFSIFFYILFIYFVFFLKLRYKLFFAINTILYYIFLLL